MLGVYLSPRPSVGSRPGFAIQSGYTLVEIMVALTLGLVVMLGVIQVFISTQQSARIQQAASRMQEDGRMAMALLSRYFRMGGYITYPWDKGGTVGARPLMRAAFQGSPVFLPLVRLWLVALSTGLTPYGFAIKVPTMDRSLLVWAGSYRPIRWRTSL